MALTEITIKIYLQVDDEKKCAVYYYLIINYKELFLQQPDTSDLMYVIFWKN